MSVMIMRAKFNVNTNFDELEIVFREKSNSGTLKTMRFHFFASSPENIFKLSPWVINEKFWKFFESVDFKFQSENSSEDCELILNQYIPRYVLFEALISRNLSVDRENYFLVNHYSVTKNIIDCGFVCRQILKRMQITLKIMLFSISSHFIEFSQ